MGSIKDNLSPWESEQDVNSMRTIAQLGHLWHYSMNSNAVRDITAAYSRSYPEALDALVRAGYILIEGKAYPMKEVNK